MRQRKPGYLAGKEKYCIEYIDKQCCLGLLMVCYGSSTYSPEIKKALYLVWSNSCDTILHMLNNNESGFPSNI